MNKLLKALYGGGTIREYGRLVIQYSSIGKTFCGIVLLPSIFIGYNYAAGISIEWLIFKFSIGIRIKNKTNHISFVKHQ